MDEQPVLLTEYSDGIAHLTINRPHRLNTLNRPLMAALRKAFRDLAEDRDVRIVRLSAAGEKAFCAGADLKEPDTHDYSGLPEFLREQPGIFDRMARCPQIIVSEVNGWALGGGLQLALFSDLVYASESASFKLPQVGLGLIPPYGTTVRLARHIGQGRAMEMMLLGAAMSGRQAFDWGFAQGVEPDAAALRDRVGDVVATLAKMPAESLALAKESLVSGWDMSTEGAALADRFRSFALKQSSVTKQIHENWRTSK
ncbi:enoyl-CoA hydratase/isomerase family protein [Amycolatopsis acidicola]|uniref:Enoyl-CoA hydratase/isomerase family protein n=1 Tax=Amycolatopsis acidicola TaxID=2596893 RepID=A0A5N0VAA4_9PSEU|nr:enoyl-CoA hydratase/isomerase family protein [Amycolatopsis acidicola]KAA9163317.1 enoyl-CoA hydratase/isomerase family protein [Amycolatopsis acidicola]